ncbi:MAG: ATPase [Sphingomonadales bacterium]|nr:ATPase [Sphingomonadales bacterium]MBD3772226.1 ATPase [Paracoccaceae bacterium]
MNGGSRIVAFGSGEESRPTSPSATDDTLELTSAQEAAPADWDEGEWADEQPARRAADWAIPALAILAVAGWTAFFGWTYRAEMLAGAAPQQWTGWISAWAIPVLLVVSLWLLSMRLSRREAARFGDASLALRREVDALETRLSNVNRELSLAREFLGAQSRELDSLGRIASEKLSRHAETLQSLVKTNGDQVESIASVSGIAMQNMNKLRDDLPVIANSARDVTSQIANAGRTASGQLGEMISGFERLNQFGEASERQVAALRTKVDAALAAFEAQAAQMEDITAARFAALGDKSEAFRTELDAREVEALAALRARADRLRDELAPARELLESEEEEILKSLQARINAIREGAATVGRALSEGQQSAVSAWQAQVDRVRADLVEALAEVSRIDAMALENAQTRLAELRQEAQQVDDTMAERNRAFDAQLAARRAEAEKFAEASAAQLTSRLAEIDASLTQRRAEQIEHAEALAAQGDAIAGRLAELRDTIAQVTGQGSEAEAKLAAGIAALAQQLGETRDRLEGTDTAIAELTESGIRLLEIIQSGARHSAEDLPKAIGVAEGRLSEVVSGAERLELMLGSASEKGAALSSYVISAREASAAAGKEAEELHGRLAEAGETHAQRLEALQSRLAALGEDSRAIADNAQGNLREALETLQQATQEAVASLDTTTTAGIGALAERVGAEAAEAVDRALRFKTTEAIAQLEQAAAHSAGVSREAAVQLRDQLAKVNELAGNLETRVQRARERAQEQVDNDFSRRVALITEALNSNAIDIAKAMSSEVTDTAWASYLRGDRGIFTRRAVRLLENTEARDIAEIYDTDPDFREHVSRYIHDFEAMLRTMLSTRDGNALGVTLLSSDMGKLYVALAQAIERLRD